jgi:YqjK-like protein
MSISHKGPLRLRRERLLVRNAELRQRLARHVSELDAPIALADQAIAGARWLRRNPEWPLAALAFWIAFRPRRALRWAVRGWWAWQAGRRLLRP